MTFDECVAVYTETMERIYAYCGADPHAAPFVAEAAEHHRLACASGDPKHPSWERIGNVGQRAYNAKERAEYELIKKARG